MEAKNLRGLLLSRRAAHQKKIAEIQRELFAHQVSIAEIDFMLKQLEEDNDHAENHAERTEDA